MSMFGPGQPGASGTSPPDRLAQWAAVEVRQVLVAAPASKASQSGHPERL